MDEYIKVIYDTYLAHVVEHKDYETFGHAMAIILPMFMKEAQNLERSYYEYRRIKEANDGQ